MIIELDDQISSKEIVFNNIHLIFLNLKINKNVNFNCREDTFPLSYLWKLSFHDWNKILKRNINNWINYNMHNRTISLFSRIVSSHDYFLQNLSEEIVL